MVCTVIKLYYCHGGFPCSQQNEKYRGKSTLTYVRQLIIDLQYTFNNELMNKLITNNVTTVLMKYRDISRATFGDNVRWIYINEQCSVGKVCTQKDRITHVYEAA